MEDSISPELIPRSVGSPPTSISNAIHLFKLARLNSEIKYVANSISHETPAYTYPRIPNIFDWQRDVLRRLHEWNAEIPQFHGNQIHLTQCSKIKYHETIMLLLRPSPSESLRLCHESSVAAIRLLDELYRRDLLTYVWTAVHSVFLATLTMLYCIWTVPHIARDTKLEVLITDLKSASNVLDATAEHWTEAKRSREVLDELSDATVRWIMDSHANGCDSSLQIRQTTTDAATTHSAQVTASSDETNEGSRLFSPPLLPSSFDVFLNSDTFGSPEDKEFIRNFDINSIMQGVFSDYSYQSELDPWQGSALV